MLARELWQSVLSPSQRNLLCRAMGLGDNPESAGLWCAFLAGLHDLGKASPAFQLRVAEARAAVRSRLQRSGLRVPIQHRPARASASHGTVTAATLPALLASGFGLPDPLARDLGAIVGGHHGTLPAAAKSRRSRPTPTPAAGPTGTPCGATWWPCCPKFLGFHAIGRLLRSPMAGQWPWRGLYRWPTG